MDQYVHVSLFLFFFPVQLSYAWTFVHNSRVSGLLTCLVLYRVMLYDKETIQPIIIIMSQYNTSGPKMTLLWTLGNGNIGQQYLYISKSIWPAGACWCHRHMWVISLILICLQRAAVVYTGIVLFQLLNAKCHKLCSMICTSYFLSQWIFK